MVLIEMTEEQGALLRRVLDRAWRELKFEIADTDNSQFKQGLRDELHDLGAMLDLVGGPLPDAATR